MFIGYYNISVILTYLGLSFSIFGIYVAFTGNISLAFVCTKDYFLVVCTYYIT